MNKFATLLIFVLCFTNTQAQSLFWQKNIFFSADTLTLDTLSIVPSSLIVRDTAGKIIDSYNYSVNYPTTQLVSPALRGQTVQVSYRTYSFFLSKIYFNKEQSQWLSGDTILTSASNFYAPYTSLSSQGLLAGTNLQHSGSIIRGINVGSNGSNSLNSEMNLQLSGKLTENISLLASISDKNLPALPEGNTASLQEFDRIFIHLYNDQSGLHAGDVELQSDTDVFEKYQRKIMGAQFYTQQKTKGGQTLHNSVAAGIAKGKFTRQTLAVFEGNQGPYRLQGEQGEENIVLISGSERVYVNGVLMERGSDADYIINYATAEITFTAKQVMRYDMRVVAEFEYSERSYARYVLTSKNKFDFKTGNSNKGNVYINAFYETDAKNQPVDAAQNDEEKRAMAAAGGKFPMAFFATADSVGFLPNEILYAKKDTVVNGQPVSIYQYSVLPQEAIFRVRFSFVGNGNGDYAIANTAANGQVYQWVGSGNGNYAAVQLLTTPKEKFLTTFGGKFLYDSLSQIQTDIAISHHNVNLFAPKPAAQKTGMAVNFSADKTFLLNQHQVFAQAKTMMYQEDFEGVDPFVNPEFERNWNIIGGTLSRSLQQYEATTAYRFAENVEVKNTTSFLGLGKTNTRFAASDTSYSAMQGVNTSSGIAFTYRDFSSLGNFHFLNTQQSERNTQFLRGDILFSQKIARITAGVRGDFEHNADHIYNQLAGFSKAFHQQEIFVNTQSEKIKSFEISTKLRHDFLPEGNELKPFQQAKEVGLNTQFNVGKNLNFKLTNVYRNVVYEDSSATAPQHLLLAREEISGTFAQGAIQTTVNYELGAGVEPKQDYIYIEVGTGMGVYTWRDYNQNNVKELNEFEIAAFKDEANYIRIALPSQEYVQTYNGGFVFQLYLQPAQIFGTEKFISRWTNNFSLSNAQKTMQQNFGKTANPFAQYANNDTTLINIQFSANNTLSYLSKNAALRMAFAWQKNHSKNYLINGFENMQSQNFGYQIGYTFFTSLPVNAGIDYTTKSLNSAYSFAEKNYDIAQINPQFGVEYSPLRNLLVSANYLFFDKRNKTGEEHAITHKISLENTYNITKKGFISANFGYVNTRYNEEVYNSVGYEMLQGFEKGNNFTWGANLNRTFNSGLQLSLLYAARRLSSGIIIHSGSVELRLNF